MRQDFQEEILWNVVIIDWLIRKSFIARSVNWGQFQLEALTGKGDSPCSLKIPIIEKSCLTREKYFIFNIKSIEFVYYIFFGFWTSFFPVLYTYYMHYKIWHHNHLLFSQYKIKSMKIRIKPSISYLKCSRNTLNAFEYPLFQNHLANVNCIWHRSSFG